MKYGMNLLLWGGALPLDRIPLLERLKAIGFDGVEVPLFDCTPEQCAELGRTLDGLGLERTAVTVRNESENLISADPRIRARGRAKNKLAVECAAALGSSLLSGPYHSAIGVFSGSVPTETEWDLALEGIREMADLAQACGLSLALEYLNRFECYLLTCANDVRRFLGDLDHAACKMMIDMFHANIEETDLGAAIRDSGEALVHVHISENNRGTPGSGHNRWDQIFPALHDINYAGWLTVEAFGLALPEMAAATKIWRRMFTSEEELARDALSFMQRSWNQCSSSPEST